MTILFWTAVALVGVVAWCLVRANPTATKATSQSTLGSGTTAVGMRDRFRALGPTAAQWPEIIQQVNPDEDPIISQKLHSFRGPYLFNPRLGINVLIAGCERAIATDPAADRAAAIRAAIDEDDRFVR